MDTTAIHSAERVKPTKLAEYLEVMSRSVFTAGISRKVVDSKWPGTKEAFDNFDPEKVARYTEDDKARLLQDKRIIRNRRKVDAIVENAIRLLELDREYNGFHNYLHSKGNYEALARDLRKQFKFIGEMGTNLFLWYTGEEVPPWHNWDGTHDGK